MKSVCIAVPERRQNVQYLTQHIPNLEVLWDDKHEGNFIQWCKAAELVAGGGLIIEDDIVLTKNFVDKVDKAIAEKGSYLIQFFSMRKDDILVGSRWDNNFLMNQCAYYPPGLTPKILEYKTVFKNKGIAPSDSMVCAAMKDMRQRYWIHVPSLVDHLMMPSTIDKRRSSKRQAKVFLDPELSGIVNLNLILKRDTNDKE